MSAFAGLLLSVLLVRDITVISPARTIPHASVLIRGDKIADVAPHIASPVGAEVIDGSGKFLIPGLIDSHVHAGTIAWADNDVFDHHPDLVQAYRTQLPRAYLAFGFTTLVDLDLRPGTVELFNGAPLHPTLFHCGPALRTTGGYGSRAKDANIADTPDQVPQAVDRVVQAGGICVKAFVEPGFAGVQHWPVPNAKTLATIRREATRHGLVMIVHANDADAWRAVIAAHADVIAHGMWHWTGDMHEVTPTRAARDVIHSAARSGIHVQPTLQSVYGDLSIFGSSPLEDPRLAFALPSQVIAYLRSDAGRAAQRAMRDEYRPIIAKLWGPGDPQEAMSMPARRASATLRIMDADGVKLLFGSDTPANQGIGNPPGLNGRLELSRWSEAGVPLAKILRAATIDNARVFHLTDRGSIEAGKRADLVILDADPRKSVNAYDAIDTVIVGGVPVPRSSLAPRESVAEQECSVQNEPSAMRRPPRIAAAVAVLAVLACKPARRPHAAAKPAAKARTSDMQTIDDVAPRPVVLDPPPVLRDEAPPPKPIAPPWAAAPEPVKLTPEDEKVRAALPFAPAIALDPVDGSKISILATTPTFEYKGRVFYFTSEENKRTFMANPDQYAKGAFAHL